jgi:aminopeptidase-like protein
MDKVKLGQQIYQWCTDLFPICRSITGPGTRETLGYLQKLLPDLEIKSVGSGTKVFDWTVPDEWQVNDAYIEDEQGNKVVDFKKHNLHLVGYSEPVDTYLTLAELDKHLYSLEEQPNAIPYVTSYYKSRWGFCLSHEQRTKLQEGTYHVVVDSKLEPGELNYGELVIPGKTDQEVFLSTYVCHPSMGNNELSGPTVTAAVAQFIQSLPNRKYTYRIVFIPETIGSIVYLSQNLAHLKEKVFAGFNITCIGDDLAYSFLPSRQEDTISDRVAKHVLQHIAPDYKAYSWLTRGSDERQYCAPGVDLPMASIMRSKYGTYPEYHTSLDDLDFISAQGLAGGATAVMRAIESLEINVRPRIKVFCEPQLGKRGLYPDMSVKGSASHVRNMMNMISYCDGKLDLLEIAEKIHAPIWELKGYIDKLLEAELIEIE